MENVAIKVVLKAEAEMTYKTKARKKKNNRGMDYNNSSRRFRP